MRYCLDAWPVMEWLADREPAASRIDEVLPTRPAMSWINLGEVFHLVDRNEGRPAAVEVVAFLRARLMLDLPTADRVLDAAAIKSRHKVSYADAFAVATAVAHGAVLLTGDAEILAGDPAWETEDLRASSV